MKTEKQVQKIIEEYQKYAEENQISLNSDKRVVEAIIKGLLKKEGDFGQKYCPCRKVSGDIKEDKKIICPCKYHLEEIKKDGHCLCRLFLRKL